jgi:hypothetical protein
LPANTSGKESEKIIFIAPQLHPRGFALSYEDSLSYVRFQITIQPLDDISCFRERLPLPCLHQK